MTAPTTISTQERIFLVEDYEGTIFLCNLQDISVKDVSNIKRLKHFWNGRLESFGKKDFKEMLLLHV